MELSASREEPRASVSDLDVAAQYADLEIRSVVEQFASASVTTAAATSATTAADDDSDDDSDDAVHGDDASVAMKDASSSSEEEDDDDEDDNEESRATLRAEIEAALEREENRATAGPLKTANEVAAVPVREPSVELTADCPIARCGTIQSANVPGLMLTIKSDANAKPLDEESVLCLDDRTVLGCVDEVFGPVMMPMYLVRFESAEKMPAKATVGTVVYFATEHTTYIVPENIRDKGTDASNIFDEETDETVYSDDEAESAAKRQNRKRNRGGNAAEATPLLGEAGSSTTNAAGAPSGGQRTSNHSDYRHSAPSRSSASASASGSSAYGGRGGGRGGGGGGAGRTSFAQPAPAPVQFQTQSHGGQTHYTQPGFAAPPNAHAGYAPVGYAPPLPMGYAQPPMPYGQPQQPPHLAFVPQLPFQHQYPQPMASYPPGHQQFYQPQPFHAAPPQPTAYFPAGQPPLPPGAYDPTRPPPRS